MLFRFIAFCCECFHKKYQCSFCIQDFRSEKSEEEIPPPSKLPKPILPKNFNTETGSFDITDIDPKELARQLALLNWSLYKKLQYSEFLDQRWNKPNSKHLCCNLLDIISFHNKVGNIDLDLK